MTKVNFQVFFINRMAVILFIGLLLSACGGRKVGEEKSEQTPITEDSSLTPDQITLMIQAEPNNAQLYYERALTYYEFDDLASALKDFDKTIELEPDFASAFHDRGICHYELDMLDKSLSDFNQAIELDEKYVEAYFNRSLVFDEIGKPKEALSDLNTAISIDPEFGDAYYNRAVYMLNTDRKKACEDFKKASEMGIEEAELTMKEYCK